LLDRERLNRCNVLNAGIIDEDVDGSELALGLVDHVGDLIVPEHIGCIENYARAMGGDLADHLLVVLLAAEAVQHDICTGAGERVGYAEADAGG
jgi:hypothetical protein